MSTKYRIDFLCLKEHASQIRKALNLDDLRKEERWYLDLTAYLLFTRCEDRETGEKIVGREHIAELSGKSYSSEWNVPDLLDAYKAKTGVAFTLREYNQAGGVCRRTKDLTFPPRLLDITNNMLNSEEKPEELVSFLTGLKNNESYRSKARMKDQVEALDALAECDNPDALRWLSLLNEMPPNRWKKVLELVPKLKFEAAHIQDPHKRINLLSTIKSIQSNPQPYYKSTDGSTRIFSTNGTILNLPRRLRKMVLDHLGVVSFDLTHAQLSIVAKVWDIPRIQDFLDTGGSFWDALCDGTGATREDKDVLKTALYSLVFGASDHRIRAGFKETGIVYTRWKKHPLIAALFEARTRTKALYLRQGYGEDAYGKRWKIERWFDRNDDGSTYTETNLLSVMAAVAQSYELRLLTPVLDVIEASTRGVQLVYNLHDGFGIMCPPDQIDYYQDLMARKVLQMSKEINIVTRLERVD